MQTFGEFFKGFFKEGSKESMARLLSFMCGVAALSVSIGALWMGLQEKLTYDYVLLAALLWAAAHGGKTWAKSVELKNKNNGNSSEV